MTAPRILALDLSLTSTGICHPDGTTTAIRVHHDGPQRLDAIAAHIEAAVDRVDIAVIEGYSYSSRNGGERLGELGGVVRLALWRRDIPYVEIAPALLKKYATGRGNASKDQVLTTIAASSGIAFATSDECDAWVLWRMARDHYQPPEITTKERAAVLARVDWPTIDRKAA